MATAPQQPAKGGTSSDITSELESFRQQWRAEVQARTTGPPPPAARSGAVENTTISTGAGSQDARAGSTSSTPASAVVASAATVPPRPGVLVTPGKLFSSGKKIAVQDNEPDFVLARAFDEDVGTINKDGGEGAEAELGIRTSLDGVGDSITGSGRPAWQSKEPVSALEYYEKAVERENEGSLGDSLQLYRRAFRMDPTVDKKYKNKHFPTPAAGSSRGSVAVVSDQPTPDQPMPATARKKTAKAGVLAINDLIASFAGLGIEAAPPPVEGMPPPPCLLAQLPEEILVHILRDVAVDDVGDYVRLSRVCKKLAFLVATEDSMWRDVCMDERFGFLRMHREWQTAVAWEPLEEKAGIEAAEEESEDASTPVAKSGRIHPEQQAAESRAMTAALRASVYQTWKHMFRTRPRIRFNGCYISTVNYIRPGQGSASLVTWNSPIHIVTYFRYLRFFRDGTAISLLTTSEPADVVHHLTKDLVALHRDSAMAHLPSTVLKGAHALRGRWRLSGLTAANSENTVKGETSAGDATADTEPPHRDPFSSLAAATEAESNLVVETEGVNHYYYRMELAFRSGKIVRNNRLQWRGFYSYNRLTDDWAEFGLKNDRPFFFSRVKSYGIGE